MENKAFVLFVLGFTFVHCVLSIPASNPRSLRISKQSLVHDLLADTPKDINFKEDHEDVSMFELESQGTKETSIYIDDYPPPGASKGHDPPPPPIGSH
ncbi:hypothetical protein BVRB_5g125400 [Beta vulgaris subsp. vulgaris]|uniref:Uncharacterized protein n=1 Tax=Beta vulgaris subsp. vulgaris TaxID=3555 RepID=A0A0J8BCD9_BETVV|nr:uncharacterized protein LOC125497514 isoform X3 [Beta vulgaris subsp. vulgaris]KMS97627.1 hypothetical protein BVRB_5g125400 [Beta vulgaris subsp. vulgaris]